MMGIARDGKDCFEIIILLRNRNRETRSHIIFDAVVLQFPGECILTYMEFQLDSAEYCQAQHK